MEGKAKKTIFVHHTYQPINMKHSCIILLLAISPLVSMGQKTNLDSLYRCLDREITKSDQYIKVKQQHIDDIKLKYHRTHGDRVSRHQLAWNLFKANETFMNDSAIHYLNECIALSRQMKNSTLLQSDYTALAHQYAATGFYNEALDYLRRIDRPQLKGQQIADYYFCCSHLYGEMGYYLKDEALKQQYYGLSNRYRDSLFSVLPSTSSLYLWCKVIAATSAGYYRRAMRYCDIWMNQVEENTPEYANMAFFRSEIYKHLGNETQQKYWLAVSALCDIRNAVMDQASLWSLAGLLSQDGDLERSNRYVEYSWNCTQRFNTHLRSWLVSPILGVISDTYKTNLRTANTRLLWLTAIVSLLSVILLGSFVYVWCKKKQLSRARNDLRLINEQLSELNRQLSNNNTQLAKLNVKLSETNKVKDEYIGKFLSTCSEYIDKIDNYRVRVNRKLRANQLSDLMKMTSSEQLKQDEIKELFNNFDAVFLNLFPNFVADFNTLLLPEHRIQPDSKTQLTTDLRIFALIRLGIEESSRIAEFLRYSPNSIYNYRARIKNKALCPREEFEQRVKEIGM